MRSCPLFSNECYANGKERQENQKSKDSKDKSWNIYGNWEGIKEKVKLKLKLEKRDKFAR